MPITVRAIDLTRLKLTTPAIMKQIGQTFLRLSRERIEAGVGSDGAPMPLYSPRYEKFRADHGRDVNRRTLVYTGKMLLARKVQNPRANSVEINFTAERDKAQGNEDRTPFVNATRAEREDLKVMAKQQIDANIAAQQAKLRAEKGEPTK